MSVFLIKITQYSICVHVVNSCAVVVYNGTRHFASCELEVINLLLSCSCIPDSWLLATSLIIRLIMTWLETVAHGEYKLVWSYYRWCALVVCCWALVEILVTFHLEQRHMTGDCCPWWIQVGVKLLKVMCLCSFRTETHNAPINVKTLGGKAGHRWGIWQ